MNIKNKLVLEGITDIPHQIITQESTRKYFHVQFNLICITHPNRAAREQYICIIWTIIQ